MKTIKHLKYKRLKDSSFVSEYEAHKPEMDTVLKIEFIPKHKL